MNTFFGVISSVLDQDLYTIEVDIPGENEKLKAFPKRGEVDEPRVGDVVYLTELDPLYHSYYLYEKLKENSFIGIRARGKIVKMNEDIIEIGIYDPTVEWKDDNSGNDNTPEPTSYIKIDKDGGINIYSEGNINILTKDGTITTSKQGGTTTEAVRYDKLEKLLSNILKQLSISMAGPYPLSNAATFTSLQNAIQSIKATNTIIE